MTIINDTYLKTLIKAPSQEMRHQTIGEFIPPIQNTGQQTFGIEYKRHGGLLSGFDMGDGSDSSISYLLHMGHILILNDPIKLKGPEDMGIAAMLM